MSVSLSPLAPPEAAPPEGVEEDIEMMNLYLDGRYYSILEYTSPRLLYGSLTPTARMAIALTLFQLGRVNIGFREMALAVELAPFGSRGKMLGHIGMCLKRKGMFREGAECYLEALSFYRAFSQGMEQSSETLEAIESILCEGYISCKERSDSGGVLRELLESALPPAYVQAQEYVLAGGVLEQNSVASVLLQNKTTIDDVVLVILRWKESTGHERRSYTVKDPTRHLFNCIKAFGLNEIYTELVRRTALVKEYIEYDASHFPEIDLNLDNKYALRTLCKISLRSALSLINLYSVIVKHNTILAFLEFLNGDYSLAFHKLEKLLELFDLVEETFSKTIDLHSHEFLSPSVKRCIAIYMGQAALNFCPTSDAIEEVLSAVIDSGMNINIKAEYISGRLDQFFLVCGGLFERLSVMRALNMNVELRDPSGNVIRLSKSELEEAIRKYIFAAVMRPLDDVVELYDRILWGLLLYGGIHVKVLWFFKFIRDYFLVANECAVIHHHTSEVCSFLPANPLTSGNGGEIVDKIYSLKDTFPHSDRLGMWNESHNSCFLVPQVFWDTVENQLILLDEFFDERYPYGAEKGFIFSTTQRAKRKLKGHLKLHESIVKFQLDKSLQFIELWIDNYAEYQTLIPEPISKFWKRYVA
ncbi:hypothetical protein BABINDRAFT_166520 [Babjeviella inositovora NRRL Y-12698]|uniref:Uncharacterized protein n=1 Tax=Babjeviella inositovora NRRL Y-12698 TaxID=984486 RepID=A0A1E3QR73_9ASCO|nr:uncharacterized protein BABINDRAFT_166520 [Babjeviella inositovora NRRL Y-12698]ODQ80150.1 hypothetical protein BABINDRAFT_166520 [Babjeviella inositovora NRRL Y-12698]